LSRLVVPQSGSLEATGDLFEQYQLVDADGVVVAPAGAYFRDLAAGGRAAATQRSYGMALLRWWRFIRAVGIGWDQATRAEARDFLCWVQLGDKPERPHWQRLEKLLEDAGIKLSSVASDILGVSGRAMLEALIAGQRDPDVLAGLARRRLRARIPELAQALEGRFSEHHGFLARVHLDLIDQHTAAIGELTRRIEQVIEPFRGFRDLICSIPGIATVTADVIVAEIGDDMSRFPTAGHLASWAGTVPGSNESAGKVKSSTTRPGNPYLQGVLGTAAMSCAQHPGTYLNAKYRRIATRRGPQKANVAIQHAILVAIWNMGTSGTFYEDPGGDYFTRLNPERARTRAIRQLESLGYAVTLAGTSAS
jgi:transposase